MSRVFLLGFGISGHTDTYLANSEVMISIQNLKCEHTEVMFDEGMITHHSLWPLFALLGTFSLRKKEMNLLYTVWYKHFLSSDITDDCSSLQ